MKVISEGGGGDCVSTFDLWKIPEGYVVRNVIRLHPLTLAGRAREKRPENEVGAPGRETFSHPPLPQGLGDGDV